jgi:hypothetical protein
VSGIQIDNFDELEVDQEVEAAGAKAPGDQAGLLKILNKQEEQVLKYKYE